MRSMFCASVALAFTIGAQQTSAQDDSRLRKLGFLSGFSASGAAPLRQILVDSLQELGYREGHNLVFIERYANGQLERLPILARELVAAKVELIATQTTPAALAAKHADGRTPVVTVTSGDAVAAGLVANLARPGGNVTGLSFLGTEIVLKQMELLRDLAPAVQHVGFLANSGIAPERNFFREMQHYAGTVGSRVTFIEARTSRDYESAFDTVVRERIDGLVVAPSIANHDEWREVVRLAARHRLPAAYAFRDFPEAGGLFSYGFNRREFYGRAATYIDKIFKGARPGELPLQQPTQFELVLNAAAIEALGLKLPPEMLLRATSVVH